MSDPTKEMHLRLALRLIGLVFLFGLYPLTMVWPDVEMPGHLVDLNARLAR